jgi:hypothetical protein
MNARQAARGLDAAPPALRMTANIRVRRVLLS